jgi:hypothetical protein
MNTLTASRFVDHFNAHTTTYQNCLKWLVRHTHDLDFESAFNVFRAIENLHSDPINGINLFPGRMSLVSLTFGNYMIEKIIVYAQGDKEICLNSVPNHTLCSKNNVSLVHLFNRYNEGAKPEKSDINPIASLLLTYSSEQIRLQHNPMPDFTRFYYLFSKNEKINNAFFEKFRIELQTFSLLCFLLYAFVITKISKEKNKKYFFTAEELKTFLSTASEISSNQIDIFLENVSIDRENYRLFYFQMRQNQGNLDNFNTQEIYDRALPKITFSFALLQYKGNYLITSIASLHEFLKMDRVYRMLTKEIDKDFKGAHIGPAIEEYARFLTRKYSRYIQDLHPNCTGNKKYYINKEKKDEPDAILETDDFVLLIECKASAFSIELFKSLNKKSIQRLIADVNKSIVNIDNYLKFHHDRLAGKKVIKLLAYYEGQADWYEMLLEDTYHEIKNHDLLIIDFNILELLLGSYTKPIPELINAYLDEKSTHSTNFELFLDRHGAVYWDHDQRDKIFEDLVKKHGIPIT